MPRAKPTAVAADNVGKVPDATSSGRMTKAATVLAMLQREQGATLSELVEATAWQPHTTRAMLTGPRKKGHAIERGKRDDITCYHLPAASV